MSAWHIRWLSCVILSVMLILTAFVPTGGGLATEATAAVVQPVEGELPEGLDVRAKGPVHEAFATPAEDSRPTPIVPQQPPEPIEELPPDHKPEGDNVVWIPGYWHWDEEEQQFIWVSGFWRAVPPGRVWVPGWWRAVNGGWQWVPGFWQTTAVQEAAGGAVTATAEVEYLPEPPASIEVGPSVPAPAATFFYVPGHWVWRGRYVWRPGFWWEFRPGWVWVPAHYRWTPLGWVYVPGYWDYPLAARGVLFAPVIIQPILWRRPGFIYTPIYVVSEPALFGALFVRRGWSCYFFGDYFGPRYVEWGFSAWCGRFGPRGGFAIGFGTGRAWGYDPLWSYYSLAYSNQPGWVNGLSTLYVGRFRGDLPRPPVNLIQQNTVINNITKTNIRNVTNNITVVNRTVVVNKTDVTPLAMLAPLKTAAQLQPEVNLRPTPPQVRQREVQQSKQFRELALQRAKLEALPPAKGKTAKETPAPVRSLQLQVPADVARRAVALPATRQPPPLPPGSSAPKGVNTPSQGGKTEPKGMTTEPKGKIEPKIEPKSKVDPPSKIGPKGKVEPKDVPFPPSKFEPKVDPKGKAEPAGKPESKGKVEPKGVPLPPVKAEPKVDPKGKFDPKGVPLPPINLDPKVVDREGKTGSKGVALPPAKLEPKIDPKGRESPPMVRNMQSQIPPDINKRAVILPAIRQPALPPASPTPKDPTPSQPAGKPELRKNFESNGRPS